MSTQQEAIQTPTTAEDIFALGAIILQMWSWGGAGQAIQGAHGGIAEKGSLLYSRQGDRMPWCFAVLRRKILPALQLRKCREVLVQYKNDLKNKVARPVNQPRII